MKTDELSFILAPSPIHGIGVFATEHIKKGTKLRLFRRGERSRVTHKGATPRFLPFMRYCLRVGGQLYRPDDFGCLSIGWYMNHSPVPNAMPSSPGSSSYVAIRRINAGDEVTVDYSRIEDTTDSEVR